MMNLVRVCKLSFPISLFLSGAAMVSAQSRCVITYQSMQSDIRVEAYVAEAVDVQPEFPGGENAMMRVINAERRYPREAYASGVEGRVMCSFIVSPDGTISNVEVLRGVDESLNREAVRIIRSMPRWHAGSVDGDKVPVYCLLTIPFRR